MAPRKQPNKQGIANNNNGTRSSTPSLLRFLNRGQQQKPATPEKFIQSSSSTNASENHSRESSLVELVSDDGSSSQSDNGENRRKLNKRASKSKSPPRKRAKSQKDNTLPHPPKREPAAKRGQNSNNTAHSNSPSAAEQWADRFRPQSSEDVALHVKRRQEVETAMKEMREGLRLLILSGPAGSSKTAITHTLSKELGFNRVIEYEPPSGGVDEVSLVDAFEDFLDGLRFGGNFDTVIVVEDLPNISHYETRQAFVKALMQWVSYPQTALPPIILIITEVEVAGLENKNYFSSNESIVVERILPKPLLMHPKVKRLKFLPVNMTLINKTLKAIVKRPEISPLFAKIPTKEVDRVIKSLTDLGDIRSAISGLEFWSRLRTLDSNKQRPISDLPVGRGSQIGLFHAIGRVIHGSHKDKNGKPVESDEATIESILPDWEMTNFDGSFSLAIAENYPSGNSSKTSIQGLEACSEILSMADTLISYPHNLFRLSTDIAARGVRTALRNSDEDPKSTKVHRALVYSRYWKAIRERRKAVEDIDKYGLYYSYKYGTKMLPVDISLYNGYYDMIINRKSKKKRVGGKIWNGNTTSLQPEHEWEAIEDNNHKTSDEDDDDMAYITSQLPPGINPGFKDNEGFLSDDIEDDSDD